MMDSDTRDAHVSELNTRGYTIFEGAFSEDDVAFMRARSEAIYDRVKDGDPYAEPPIRLSAHVYKTNMGLNVLGVAHFDHELVGRLVHSDVVEVLRGALGDVRFEMASIMFSNESRPFVRWHTHTAGFSETDGNTERGWPSFDALERITVIGYLNELTEESGELLLYPRAVSDPTAPPFDQREQHWPGELVVRCPRGSIVLLDQATWHAVRPQRRPGMRILVGGLFASARTPTPEWYDRTLIEAARTNPSLRSLLPHVDT